MQNDTNEEILGNDETTPETKKISKKQYKEAAEMVFQEFKRRKEHKNRVEVEKAWKEVDRQVAMIPKTKQRKDWHPVFELPYQANALEVLHADVDNMMFPGTGVFFNVQAQMTDEYLAAFEQDIDFLGTGNPEESIFRADQVAINAVNQGILMKAHSAASFQDQISVSNVEAIKYGTRAVRLRGIKKTSFVNANKGVLRSESIMPVVAPISIKDFYPDDIASKAIAHGTHLTPMQMLHGKHRITDLKLAADAGSKDTEDNENGGWLKEVVANLSTKDMDNPFVDFIEVEGDFVFPVHNGKDIIARNTIVTVIFGKGVGGPQIIRIRENPYSFNSVFYDQFFKHDLGCYGISPLMKGVSIQDMAQMAAEDVVIVGKLQSDPPIRGNRSDPLMRAKGGYNIAPGAQMDSISKPEVFDIGDLAGAAAVFQQLTKQYEDTSGVNSTRLGGQTKSHQTAYAIETEEMNGQSRTVSFVRSTENGFLTSILQGEAEILRKHMTPQNIYCPELNGYVVASGKSLAPDITFMVRGSSAANEERKREMKIQQTLQGLVPLNEQIAAKGGKQLNLQKVAEYFLREALPSADVATFFEDVPQPAAPAAPQQGGPAGPPQQLPQG